MKNFNSSNNSGIDTQAMQAIFLAARTHSHWQKREVADDVLRKVYDAARMAPTSANCSPFRIHFVKSQSAKERLKKYLQEGNVDKTMTAPVTAIIGMDMEFYELMPKLFPHTDARSWFVGNDALIQETAFRNSSLQGAYFIIAARAYGLDCDPMSGFDRDGVNKEFFSNTKIKSNFLCNIGYGDSSKLYPRNTRLEFDDACKVI